MPKNWKKLALTLAAVALVGAGCTTNTSTTIETPTATAEPTIATDASEPVKTKASVEVKSSISTAKTYTVEMAGDGFSPTSLSIKKGDTVTFKNVGSNSHWPASAPHPTHTVYPEFDPKSEVAPGQSWSFIFDKVGTWRYHDHLNSGETGVITVTE